MKCYKIRNFYQFICTCLIGMVIISAGTWGWRRELVGWVYIYHCEQIPGYNNRVTFDNVSVVLNQPTDIGAPTKDQLFGLLLHEKVDIRLSAAHLLVTYAAVKILTKEDLPAVKKWYEDKDFSISSPMLRAGAYLSDVSAITLSLKKLKSTEVGSPAFWNYFYVLWLGEFRESGDILIERCGNTNLTIKKNAIERLITLLEESDCLPAKYLNDVVQGNLDIKNWEAMLKTNPNALFLELSQVWKSTREKFRPVSEFSPNSQYVVSNEDIITGYKGWSTFYWLLLCFEITWIVLSVLWFFAFRKSTGKESTSLRGPQAPAH